MDDGAVGGFTLKEQKKRSQEIDAMLREEKKRQMNQCTLLMLGTLFLFTLQWQCLASMRFPSKKLLHAHMGVTRALSSQSVQVLASRARAPSASK